jgi:hypothetical protein
VTGSAPAPRKEPRPNAELGRVAYFLRRVRKHAHWARTEGVRRLIEEDQLDPRARIGTALAKARWRRANKRPAGSAVPVYVVGLQRSGTNMLLRGLDAAPEIEVRGENDKTVFFRYRLRSPEVLRSTIARSRHAIVLVKPICDSQRVPELLALSGVAPGRAIWAYRDVDDRARSEVSKFGDANLRALRQIAAGQGESIWQGELLGPEAVALVASFDYDPESPTCMSPDTAAALFWVVRNGLYFGLGLDARPDVMLSSYDALVADPEASMRELCDFIGFPCRPALWDHVEARTSHARRPLDIDPRVRELSDAMAARLEAARRAQSHPAGAVDQHDLHDLH